MWFASRQNDDSYQRFPMHWSSSFISATGEIEFMRITYEKANNVLIEFFSIIVLL